MPGLSFVVIVHHLGVAQLQVHGPVRLPYTRDLPLERNLCAIRFRLCLLVLRLPFFGLEGHLLNLLFQLSLTLFSIFDIALELLLELLATSLEVGEISLKLFVLFLVVF